MTIEHTIKLDEAEIKKAIKSHLKLKCGYEVLHRYPNDSPSFQSVKEDRIFLHYSNSSGDIKEKVSLYAKVEVEIERKETTNGHKS